MIKRVIGIDMIKVLAIFMVSGLHFFLNTGYYDMQMNSYLIAIESFVKWFMLSAVALFILTIGYLQCEKQPSKKYYKNLLPILITNVGISCIILLYRIVIQGIHFSFSDFILAITEFEADRYAWYVNMFIGLYLMIPFLNRMIEKISKKEYKIWLLILVIVITIPYTIHPFLELRYQKPHTLFPDWWIGMYPLLFYFTGAYIRKFQPCVKNIHAMIGIFFMLCIQTGLSAFSSYRNPDLGLWLWNDIGTAFMYCQTVLLFLLLYHVNLKSKILCNTITFSAQITLEMLLFSSLVDEWVYQSLPNISQEKIFLYGYIPIIIVLILLNFLLAFLYRKLQDWVLQKTGIYYWIRCSDS